MSLYMRPAVKRSGRKRDANWISPRVLLLFSCLMVMMFSRVGIDRAALGVGALLVPAVTSGLALLRPMPVGDQDQERRAELALVVTLLLAGLLSTAGTLALALADLGSPVWLTVTSVYMILGLVGGLLLGRRLPHVKWVFPLFLLAHAAVTVTLLRSAPAHIDVEVVLREGAAAVLHGHNPYTMTVPNIYPPALIKLFYGSGVVVNGQISGFPYLPVALLVAIPGYLLGDVRYSQLIAMLVTALVLRRLASDRIGRALAVLGVAAPAAIQMLIGAWTEPTLVALLACLVLALERNRHFFVTFFLGLFLVSKQYVVIALPVVWLIRGWLTRRVILTSVSLAAAMTLPFFVIDPTAFWRSIMGIQSTPFRSDSLSLLAFGVNTFGWPPPWTYAALPLVGGGLTALALAVRAPRTLPAFAAGVGLTLLVTILLSKQAFMNYYFLVSGAFLIAAVAWPTQPEPAKPPASTRHGEDQKLGDCVGWSHDDDEDTPQNNHAGSEHGSGIGFLAEHEATGGEDRHVSRDAES